MATVFGRTLSIRKILYQSVKSFRQLLRKPFLVADKFWIHSRSKIIDWQLILGSAFFGIGWRFSMICPGPALFSATLGDKGIEDKGILLGGTSIFAWLPRRSEPEQMSTTRIFLR
jgi:uncharacterized membrane protein YedE/YeeE